MKCKKCGGNVIDIVEKQISSLTRRVAESALKNNRGNREGEE